MSPRDSFRFLFVFRLSLGDTGECIVLSLFHPDLASLQSIRLGDWSVSGDGSYKGIVKENRPSAFLNRLVMKGGGRERVRYVDLPSLTRLEAKSGCFQDIGYVSLESANVCGL